SSSRSKASSLSNQRRRCASSAAPCASRSPNQKSSSASNGATFTSGAIMRPSREGDQRRAEAAPHIDPRRPRDDYTTANRDIFEIYNSHGAAPHGAPGGEARGRQPIGRAQLDRSRIAPRHED